MENDALSRHEATDDLPLEIVPLPQLDRLQAHRVAVDHERRPRVAAPEQPAHGTFTTSGSLQITTRTSTR